MASHLSFLTERETSALGSARIRVGGRAASSPTPTPRSTGSSPTGVELGSGSGAGPGPRPCPAGGLRRAQASASDLRRGANPASGAHPVAFPDPQLPPAVPPLALPLPAPVWPGFAAAAPAAAAIGLRPAASPSPGSRRGVVSACVARGGAGWGRLCVRPRLDRTRSGTRRVQLGIRGLFLQGASSLVRGHR